MGTKGASGERGDTFLLSGERASKFLKTAALPMLPRMASWHLHRPCAEKRAATKPADEAPRRGGDYAELRDAARRRRRHGVFLGTEGGGRWAAGGGRLWGHLGRVGPMSQKADGSIFPHVM